jgi:uncharacterized cupin superfamily protein
MADVTIKRVEDLDYYRGEKKLSDIQFRYAGKELGVTAWGMNVLDLDPMSASHPEHDHVENGQEEVYVCLRGSAMLYAGGEAYELEPCVLARVGPAVKRKIVAGPEGATVLAIGATPGQAYPAKR